MRVGRMARCPAPDHNRDGYQEHVDLTGSDEEYWVRKTRSYHLDLKFFGVATRINVRSEREVSQWSYFFKHFVTRRTDDPAIELWLCVDRSDDSFIESIFAKDFRTKSIYVREQNRFQLWVRFDKWSKVASPLPPFMLEPLRRKVTLFNASCVKPAG